MKSDFMAMRTIFVVKNCAPHDENPLFTDEKLGFTAIQKEYVLLLKK